jgi:hypothetical protein
MNVERPLVRSSDAPIRVKMRSMGPMTAAVAGTKAEQLEAGEDPQAEVAPKELRGEAASPGDSPNMETIVERYAAAYPKLALMGRGRGSRRRISSI